MPTYLLHGFRWQRALIRIHIILQDLEDAAAEWIVAPATSITLLNSFYTLFDFLPPSHPPPTSYPMHTETPSEVKAQEEIARPRTLTKKNKGSTNSLARGSRPSSMGSGAVLKTSSDGHENGIKRFVEKPSFNDWSVVKFVEQYDPQDLHSASQMYAYVADYVVEVGLSASLAEEMAKYEAQLKSDEAAVLNPPVTSGPHGAASNDGAGSPALSAREARRKSKRLGWFEKLRDGLEREADIGWYVVYCGDEDRECPSMESHESQSQDSDDDEEPVKMPRNAGFRGLFTNRKKHE